MNKVTEQAEKLYPFPDKKYFDDWDEYAEAKTYSIISEEAHIKALTDPSIYQEVGLDKVEWISVEDRLPTKDGNSSVYCLVVAKGYGIVVRPYNEYHQVWDDEDGDDTFTEGKGGKVTHWMPLPSPPKTDNNEY